MSNKKKQKLDYIIDATNVCSWHKVNINNQGKGAEYTTSINVILKLASVLHERKKVFKCIFDANTPWRLEEKEQDIYKKLLQVFEEYFYQVTGGQLADTWVLALAEKFNAKVISNDRFRDYHKDYKWLAVEDDRLIKGGLMNMADELQLCLPNLKIVETIEEDTNQLFVKLAKQMGLQDKVSLKGSGRIKFYSVEKEYGFLFNDDNDEEIYFSKSDLQMNEDVMVDFEIFSENGKRVAKKVTPKSNADVKEYIAKKATQDKSKKKTNKKVASNDNNLKNGAIVWYNEEKAFGQVVELDNNKTYMFKKDAINDETLSIKAKTKVSFSTFTKGDKTYATNLVAYKEDKETAELRIKFQDFKQKLAEELPLFNFRINGKIKDLKTKSAFIKVENAKAEVYYKLADGLKLKEGDAVSFNLGINDYGFYAYDVKEEKEASKQENKIKTKEVKPQVNKKREQPQAKNKEEAPKKAKIEEKIVTEQPKKVEVEMPKTEQLSLEIKNAETEEPKAKNKEAVTEKPKRPVRKGPAQRAAEKLDRLSILEELPGEKLSKSFNEKKKEPEQKVATEKPKEVVDKVELVEDKKENVEIIIDTSIEDKLAKIEAEKQTPPRRTTEKTVVKKADDSKIEDKLAKIEAEKQKMASKIATAKTPVKTVTNKKTTTKTTDEVAINEVIEVPVTEEVTAKKPTRTAAKKTTTVKKTATAKKTSTRKTAASKTEEEVANETKEVEVKEAAKPKTTRKVAATTKKVEATAKTTEAEKPKTTRTRKTAAQKKAESTEQEATVVKKTPTKRKTTTAKKATRKTSAATKKAIATKPRKTTTRRTTKKTTSEDSIEQVAKDLEIPFIVMPEDANDKKK